MSSMTLNEKISTENDTESIEIDECMLPEWLRSINISCDDKSNDENEKAPLPLEICHNPKKINEKPKPNFHILAQMPDIKQYDSNDSFDDWRKIRIITGNVESDDGIKISSSPNHVRTAKIKSLHTSLVPLHNNKKRTSKGQKTKARNKEYFYL